jgi:catechol 2,3-dioxygenase-like lactoylglutathione lyase family enzyme
MPEIIQITPFLLCNDIQREIAFFRDRLGFELGFEGTEPNYAFMRRDRAAVRLLETEAALTDRRQEQMVYLDVSDVDALWDEISPQLADLPAHRVRAPFNQVYNQREFHVIDEGACLLMFGMAHPYPGEAKGDHNGKNAHPE